VELQVVRTRAAATGATGAGGGGDGGECLAWLPWPWCEDGPEREARVLGARMETTRSMRVAVVIAIVGAISWNLLRILGNFLL
jgi:hypothetical protein